MLGLPSFFLPPSFRARIAHDSITQQTTKAHLSRRPKAAGWSLTTILFLLRDPTFSPKLVWLIEALSHNVCQTPSWHRSGLMRGRSKEEAKEHRGCKGRKKERRQTDGPMRLRKTGRKSKESLVWQEQWGRDTDLLPSGLPQGGLKGKKSISDLPLLSALCH